MRRDQIGAIRPERLHIGPDQRAVRGKQRVPLLPHGLVVIHGSIVRALRVRRLRYLEEPPGLVSLMASASLPLAIPRRRDTSTIKSADGGWLRS